MSKKAVEILRSKMTLEERKEFIDECVRYNGENWWKSIDKESISDLFAWPKNSFIWYSSRNGHSHWTQIYNRFTEEELVTIIYLNEF
jgi:hypothetical protein